MMYHRIEIIGNVGKDTEMRYLPNGTAVTNFPVAVNEQFTNSGGEKIKRTIWYRVSTFGKLAEVCNQYVNKGKRVFVAGTLTADPQTGGPKVWTKADGTFGASFELRASEVKFLSFDEGGEHQQDAVGVPEDDMPF